VKAYTTRVGEGYFPTELFGKFFPEATKDFRDSVGDAIRKEGNEFGATTGRPRRCGWLDIPLLKHSINLNNYDSLNLTKLDVLSIMDEIKIGVRYKINGEVIDHMPSTMEELAQVEVEYETMKGYILMFVIFHLACSWKTDISKCKSFAELPQEAQDYINRVEELLGIPFSWINTAAERDSIFQHHQN